jgi:putative Ig domain-containing protein
MKSSSRTVRRAMCAAAFTLASVGTAGVLALAPGAGGQAVAGAATTNTSTYTLDASGQQADLPEASWLQPYSLQLLVPGFSAPQPIKENGALPMGLTISPTGLISGTPEIFQGDGFEVTFTTSTGAVVTQPLILNVGSGEPALDPYTLVIGDQIVAALTTGNGTGTGLLLSVLSPLLYSLAYELVGTGPLQTELVAAVSGVLGVIASLPS